MPAQPHLDHLTPSQLEKFCQALTQAELDALLISGDIADAKTLEGFLLRLESYLQRPIFFVLGDHDYYYGSILAVRAAMRALTERSRYLNWLPTVGVVALTEQTGLIGHDEIRSEYAQFACSLFVLIVGPGRWSLDAWFARARKAVPHSRV